MCSGVKEKWDGMKKIKKLFNLQKNPKIRSSKYFRGIEI
jgi:hypothetical protein